MNTFTIVTKGKCKTNPACKAREGRIFHEGDPKPPFHEGCECVLIPIQSLSQHRRLKIQGVIKEQQSLR